MNSRNLSNLFGLLFLLYHKRTEEKHYDGQLYFDFNKVDYRSRYHCQLICLKISNYLIIQILYTIFAN